MKKQDAQKDKEPALVRCFAYTESGVICGKPATVLDPQRGCMVCLEHTPPKEKGG